MTNNLVTRLTVEGVAEVVSAAKQYGDAYVAASGRSEQAFDRAIAKAGGLEAMYDRLAEKARQAVQAEEEAARIAGRNADYERVLGVRDIGSVKSASDAAEVFQDYQRQQQAAENLRREIDPLYAAQARYNDEVLRVKALLDAGTLAENEYTTAVERASNALRDQRSRIEGTAEAYQALVTRAREAARAEAESAAAAERNANIGMASGVRDPSGFKSARDSAEVFQEYDRQAASANALRAALDPLVGAQMRYNAALENLEKLKPHLTLEEYDRALKKIDADLDKFQKSQLSNRGSQFTAFQLQNLSYQANDIVTGILSGQGLLQVGAQQLGQVFQILQVSEGGVAGGLKALLGLLNPATVGIAALATATTAATVVAIQYADSQDKLALSLMGIGKVSGLTVADLEKMAEVQSNAANISVGSAREIEAGALRMGITNKEVLEGLIAVSRDYALVTGQDAAAANQQLARAMQSPATAGIDVLRSLGQLDSKTRDYIVSLEQQGRHEEAQEALMARYSKALDGAGDHVLELTKKINGMAKAWGDMWNRVGQEIALSFEAPGSEAKDAALLSKYSRNDYARFKYLDKGQLDFRSKDEIYSASYAEYDAAVGRQKWRETYNGLNKDTGAQTQIDINSADAFGRINPNAKRRQELTNDLALVRQGFAAGKRTAEEWAQAQASYKRQMAALDKQENPAAPGASRLANLQRQADALKVNTEWTLKLSDAWLLSGAAALKVEAQRKAMTDATRKGTLADVQAQMNAMIAERALEGAKLTADLRDRAGVQEKINAAVQAGLIPASQANDAQQKASQLLAIQTAAEAASGQQKLRLKNIELQLSDAIDREAQARATAALQQEAARNQDDIARMRLELELTMANNEQREVALALFDAERRVRDSHLNMDDPAQRQTAEDSVSAARDAAHLRIRVQQAQIIENIRRDQADAADMARVELALSGQTAEVRERELALRRQYLDLQRQGLDMGSTAIQQILGAERAQQAMNREIERSIAHEKAIRDIHEKSFDELAELFARGETQWSEWRAAGIHAIQDVLAQMLYLAAINPLKNKLFGTNEPTLADGGGWMSTFLNAFGFGGGDGSVASASKLGGANAMSAALQAGASSYKPAFANGVENFGGGWARVHRDEDLFLPRGTSVRTAQQSREMFRRATAKPAAPVIQPAPVIKLDLGGTVGPLADLLHGMVNQINEGMQQASDSAVERSRRELAVNLENLDLWGQLS